MCTRMIESEQFEWRISLKRPKIISNKSATFDDFAQSVFTPENWGDRTSVHHQLLTLTIY